MGAEDFTVPDTHRHRWKHHTLAEKQALIVEIERQVKTGRGVRPVARELGIAPGNYYRWLSEGLRPAAPAVEVAQTVAEMPVPAPDAVDARERARIISAVRAALEEGTPVKVSAKRHGITEGTFYRWVREAGRKAPRPAGKEPAPPPALAVRPPDLPAFRAVTVAVAAPEPATVGLVLVAPGGYRLEGLNVASAAALLRALA
jgi:transposase-like protein